NKKPTTQHHAARGAGHSCARRICQKQNRNRTTALRAAQHRLRAAQMLEAAEKCSFHAKA
ncbi:hypothetical protein A2U01_0090851, partial [Trifolium medium]|nr:hypothetical protein [Trifolium medium]